MTHRPELISEEWMHELTLEQLNSFRLFPKLTSASIPTDPRNKPVCYLFYNGCENISKRAVNMKLLDTWQWQIHTSHAHAQGILFYWMHGKFTGMHGKFTGLHGKFTVHAWLSRVRALYAYMSCTAQTVGQ